MLRLFELMFIEKGNRDKMILEKDKKECRIKFIEFLYSSV